MTAIDWVRLDDRLPEERRRLLWFTNGVQVMSGWRLEQEVETLHVVPRDNPVGCVIESRMEPVWQISGMRTFWPPTHWAYVEFPETSEVWPSGCVHPNICANQGQCTQVGCIHHDTPIAIAS